MRTSANLPVAGACGPPVLPTALRAYGRNLDPPGGALPLPPRHRRGGTLPNKAVKQEQEQEQEQEQASLQAGAYQSEQRRKERIMKNDFLHLRLYN